MINPKYYAFFDVDGTLIKGTPMLDFLNFYYNERFKYFSPAGNLAYAIYLAKAYIINKLTGSRPWLNQLYYRCYRNQSVEKIQLLGHTWYQEFKKEEYHFHSPIIRELRWHQQQGAAVVLVSGSFSSYLEPLADDLKVNHVLCTNLFHKNGYYTGKIQASMIGDGKVTAIQQFLKDKNFSNLDVCYAYGDHLSDLPMLKLVGNPRVIAGDTALEDWATYHKIPILSTA